ncbi:hypothetical protein V5G24_23345 [Xanthobacter sp. VTT E-85241]|uniref:hypothetical protein n=1 Tax=Roseixanthobacter finlandensis TaxID=3119922 RepID=UPI00372C991B
MKTIDIEHLVRWAYCDELPKVGRPTSLVAAIRSGWSSLSRYGELLTVVQEPDILNQWGLVPLEVEGGDPHPDALAVAAAVEDLAKLDVELPEGWNPLTDMGDLGEEGAEAVRRGLDRLSPLTEEGRRKVRQPLSRLVIRQAILGCAPAWEAGPPVRRVVSGANGKPRWFRQITHLSPGAFGPVASVVEIDGFNGSRQRPFPGAYRKFELVPDPAPIVVERGEYELWIAALGCLAETLADQGLSAHLVHHSARPARPWEAHVCSAVSRPPVGESAVT